MADSIAKASVILSSNHQALVDGLEVAKSGLSSFNTVAKSATHSLKDMAGEALGIPTSLGGAFKAALDIGIETASKLEKLSVQFGYLVGSASAGEAAVKRFEEAALQLRVNPEQFITAGKKLVAFGMDTEAAGSTLTGLADVAAVSGAAIEDLAGIFGKVQMQGFLTEKTWRKLVQTSPELATALKTEIGGSMEDFKKKLTEGDITAQELGRTLQKLTGQGGQFAGAAEAMGKTLGEAWASAKNELSSGLGELAQSSGLTRFIERVGEGAHIVSDFIKDTKHKFGSGQGAHPDGTASRAKVLTADEEAQEEASKGAKKLTDELTKQIDTFGLSAEAIKARDFANSKASDTEKAAVAGLFARVDALNAAKKAEEDAKKLREGLMSAEEKYAAEQQKIIALRYADKISHDEQNAALDKLKKAYEEASPAGKLAADIKKLDTELQESISTFGQSAEEAKVWGLQHREGTAATDEQVRSIRDLSEQLQALKKDHELEAEATRLREQLQTPWEAATESIKKYRELLMAGKLDMAQYLELVGRAGDKLKSPKEEIKLGKSQRFGSAEAVESIQRFQFAGKLPDTPLLAPAIEGVKQRDKMIEQGKDILKLLGQEEEV